MVSSLPFNMNVGELNNPYFQYTDERSELSVFPGEGFGTGITPSAVGMTWGMTAGSTGMCRGLAICQPALDRLETSFSPGDPSRVLSPQIAPAGAICF